MVGTETDAPSFLVSIGRRALRNASPTGTTPSWQRDQLTEYSLPSLSRGKVNHSSVSTGVALVAMFAVRFELGEILIAPRTIFSVFLCLK